MLYKYKLENSDYEYYREVVKGLEIKDKIILSHKEIAGDYLEFKGIKIRNDFDKFTIIEADENTKDLLRYNLYDESGNRIAFLSISGEIYNTFVDDFKNNFEVEVYDKKLKNSDFVKILKKNNITNDKELFMFLANYKLSKSNIFTSVKKIKDNYYVNFMTTSYSAANYITELGGYYTGFIFNCKGVLKIVYLLKDNKYYNFMFLSSKDTNYFNDDYIKELLETVVIE